MIHTVQTSNRWVENDLALLPTFSTNRLSNIDKLKPLLHDDGRMIPRVTVFLLLGITSQALTLPSDGIEFKSHNFTNPVIKYELGLFNKSMESKRITTPEEALAFLKSIRLSFSTDSFDREEANARR